MPCTVATAPEVYEFRLEVDAGEVDFAPSRRIERCPHQETLVQLEALVHSGREIGRCPGCTLGGPCQDLEVSICIRQPYHAPERSPRDIRPVAVPSIEAARGHAGGGCDVLHPPGALIVHVKEQHLAAGAKRYSSVNPVVGSMLFNPHPALMGPHPVAAETSCTLHSSQCVPHVHHKCRRLPSVAGGSVVLVVVEECESRSTSRLCRSCATSPRGISPYGWRAARLPAG